LDRRGPPGQQVEELGRGIIEGVGGSARTGQAMRFRDLWDRLIGDESGVTALEYALIASLIFLVIVASVQLMSGNVTDLYNTIANAVSDNM
ncbi:MAG TPA: Flp family type IVb pilin, partial [Rhodospirillales bacterium]|nr:Flp family type IVb pilin [Rhodospirillales bacterium]